MFKRIRANITKYAFGASAVPNKISIEVETHSLYLGFIVYAMLHENAKNDAGVVQKLKAINIVGCKRKGICKQKWFDWSLILKAAKQANLHHFQNS